MSQLSLKKGRVNQKLQTRTEILQAAKSLMKTRKKITLEDVAAKANISRATIYRYYPNVELLVIEATLDVHHRTPSELKESTKELSLRDSIYYLQNHYNQQALDHETVFRRYLSIALSASISGKRKVRGARRVAALKNVLQPFKNKISKEDYTNLINISALLMGIDAVVVSKDVCGLNNHETEKTLKWGVEMILKGLSVEK